jgi:hypothetical protein
MVDGSDLTEEDIRLIGTILAEPDGEESPNKWEEWFLVRIKKTRLGRHIFA